MDTKINVCRGLTQRRALYLVVIAVLLILLGKDFHLGVYLQSNAFSFTSEPYGHRNEAGDGNQTDNISEAKHNNNGREHDDSNSSLPSASSLIDLYKNYTQCMLETEQMMHPLIYKWREERIPFPYSVKIIDGQFYALVLIDHVRHLENRLRDSKEILCNGIRGGTIYGFRTRYRTSQLVVRCPAVVDPTVSALTTLSFVTTPDNNINNTQTYTHDTVKFDECERMHIAYFKLLQGLRGRPAKVGLTATIRSEIFQDFDGKDKGKSDKWKKMRQATIQWATYHHLLGVEHIWIYINEPWYNGMDMPYRDYITWIPYNMNIYNYPNFTKFPGDQIYMECFRGASQTDAIWRARQAGMDWIAMIDIDEYIRVGSPCREGRCNTTTRDPHAVGALSRFLERVTPTASSDANSTGSSIYKDEYGRIMGGIRLESNRYTRNSLIDTGKNIKNVLDNVWRIEGDANYTKSGTQRDSRHKAIIVPNMVVSYQIHYVTGSSVPAYFCCNGLTQKYMDDDVTVNHYKNPWKRKNKGKLSLPI